MRLSNDIWDRSRFCRRSNSKQVAQRATIAHLSPMCQGQISFQKFKLIQALMLVLVTWKYQKDPIKNNREKGQLTPQSVMGSVRNSNSYKLLCMSSLPASMKRIRSKTAEKTWWLRFSHYKSMGIFFRRSRAANSVVGSLIWPKFELIQDIMHVLITCKFEKDRINSNGEKVVTSIF